VKRSQIIIWANSIKATSAGSDIADFGDEVQKIIDSYLVGDTSAGSAKDQFLRLVDENWIDISHQAWLDGGRDLADLSTDRLVSQLSEQRQFARDAWDKLQEQIKQAQADGRDITELGAGFGDRWASGLWGQYNQVKMQTYQGTKQLFQWVLGATEKHCSTCLMLAAGGPHTSAWFEARGYIPGMNGSSLECGGWNCDCYLIDVQGHDVTLTED
jgi:hypothetical protein